MSALAIRSERVVTPEGTRPAVVIVPWFVSTAPMLTPVGIMAVTVTPAEPDGPSLTTLNANVTDWPSRIVEGSAEAVTEMSAEGVTLENVLTVLLERIGSA